VRLTISAMGVTLLEVELTDSDPPGACDALTDPLPVGFSLPARDGGAPELVDRGTHRE
jgi:hypothetical protein